MSDNVEKRAIGKIMRRLGFRSSSCVTSSHILDRVNVGFAKLAHEHGSLGLSDAAYVAGRRPVLHRLLLLRRFPPTFCWSDLAHGAGSPAS